MTRLEKLHTAWVLLLLPTFVGMGQPALGADMACFYQPQDSLWQAVEEHEWAHQKVLAPHFEVPSLRTLQYATSLSRVEILFSSRRGVDITPSTEGARHIPFQIHCGSLFHLDSLSSVWGKAAYTNAFTQNVQGREAAHYALTAPYTSVDTLGGFFASECYTFSGGYSRAFATEWRWGIEGGYEAYQESRDRDPRVLNSSGDLNIKAGLAYKMPSHYLGVSLSGRIYKQVHQMSFMNPLGAQFVFNLLGFDEYSLRFVGNAEAKAFNVYGYGFEADLLPHGSTQPQRFFATASYHHLGLEYTLKNRNELRLAYLRSHRASLVLSYLSSSAQSSWVVSNKLDLERRLGDESLYGMQKGITYPLLTVEQGNYKSLYFGDHLQGLLSLPTRGALWELLPSICWEFIRQERNSSGALEQYSLLTPGVSLRYHTKIDRVPRLALRAQLGVEQRLTLQDVLCFGALPSDPFFHPFTLHLRSLAEQNHKIQTSNQTQLATSLRGEYLLPSWQVALYAQIGADLYFFSRRAALYKLQASVGILF